MDSVLIFVAALAAIALLGWIVSKRTGSRAWFIEDWKYNDGETIIWRDDRADVVVVTKLGRAATLRPFRLHRSPVVVTNQRILIGLKTFTGKQMVRYVLYPGTSPDEHSKQPGGGLLTRGYSALVIEPGVMTAHPHEKLPLSYIELTPLAAEPSSFNLAEIRIYTDLAATFRLP